MERSLGFYGGVLRLIPERVEAFRAGKVLFPSVRINENTLIDIMPADATESLRACNMDHICLSLPRERWQEIVDSLPKHGIEIEAGPMTLWGARGEATSIYIQDPEGNRVELRYYDD
jgi:extradiol dioxygenase family protein